MRLLFCYSPAGGGMPPKGMDPVICRACWAAGGIFKPVPVEEEENFSTLIWKLIHKQDWQTHLHLKQTFRQPSHELQTACCAKVDASPLQLIIVQKRTSRGRIWTFCDVSHLHGTSCQLKPVQLLQRLLCTLCICKLQRIKSLKTEAGSEHWF